MKVVGVKVVGGEVQWPRRENCFRSVKQGTVAPHSERLVL